MTCAVPTPALQLSADLLTGTEWSAGAACATVSPDRGREGASGAAIATALAGRFLALILEKPSLRTRVTFEVGMHSLGGTAMFLDQTDSPLGERESIPDVARNLSRWVQGIVARVFAQRSSKCWRSMPAFR